jgi:hypothetical protein
MGPPSSGRASHVSWATGTRHAGDDSSDEDGSSDGEGGDGALGPQPLRGPRGRPNQGDDEEEGFDPDDHF